MTTNELTYWRDQETKRNNKEQLAEVNRHNLQVEDYNNRNLDLLKSQLAETNRSNLAKESLGRDTLSETNRSNLAREGISKTQLDLDYAKLAETNRSNLANEELSRVRNMLTKYQTDVQRQIAVMTNEVQKEANALKDYSNQTDRLNFRLRTEQRLDQLKQFEQELSLKKLQLFQAEGKANLDRNSQEQIAEMRSEVDKAIAETRGAIDVMNNIIKVGGAAATAKK